MISFKRRVLSLLLCLVLCLTLLPAAAMGADDKAATADGVACDDPLCAEDHEHAKEAEAVEALTEETEPVGPPAEEAEAVEALTEEAEAAEPPAEEAEAVEALTEEVEAAEPPAEEAEAVEVPAEELRAVSKAEPPVELTSLEGGGTVDDPYLIYTAEDLMLVQNALSASYVLEADVDLSDTAFMPIGNGSRFSGIFDGQGHTVTISLTSTGSNVGLFSENHGMIRNLTVSGSVSGGGYVGLLAAINYGTVTNCFTSGSVTGSGDRVGGLVGYNEKTITLSGSTAAVSGKSYVGGLVGYSDGSGTALVNCYAQGNVIGTDSYIGGLVGRQYYGYVRNCYASGLVNDGNGAGLIDYCYDTTLLNNYFRANNTGNTIGFAASVDAMKQQATFYCWDFENLWAIDGGYPYLNVRGEEREIEIEGEGNVDEPYQLETEEQLYALAMGFARTGTGIYYELANDIAITTPYWTSINFVGDFNGQGHTVTLSASSGLFGENTGTIHELKVSGSLSGGNYAGLLVNRNNGTVQNCFTSGTVSGNKYLGGLAGYNNRTITQCGSTATVSGSEYIGGLVGYNDSGNTVSNCYARGDVSSSNGTVAGLVGYQYYGTVRNCYASGLVNGGNGAGLIHNFNSATLENCYYNSANTGNEWGIPVSVAALKQQSTFADWDFDTIWTVSSAINEGYPYLRGCVPVTSEPTVPVTGVSLNKTSLTLNVGENETLTATVTPSSATNPNVTWSTGNAAIATVIDGTVLGVGNGETIVTVTTEDGGFTAQCMVTVAEVHTHTPGEAVRENTVEATCTQNGGYDLVVYCTVCGEELSREHVTVLALGHDYRETERVEPTEDQDGYIRYNCSRCGATYDEVLQATGEDIVIRLTWGENPRDLDSHMYIYDSVTLNESGGYSFEGNRGHTAYYSKRYSENDRLAAELDYDDVNSYGPENTTIYAPISDGIYLFKVHDFTNRNNYASRALSNSYATVELFKGSQAWLDENGEPYVFHVPVDIIGCTWDVFFIEAASGTVTVLNRLEHDWDEWLIHEATCTEYGYRSRVCRDCGTVETEILESMPPLGHEFTVSASQEPGVDTAGWNEYTCSRCGYSYRVEIAPLDCDYEESVRESATCSEDGYIEYFCAIHNHSYRVILPATGHDYQISEVVEATCTEDGYTTYTCANCGDTYASDFVDALGHSFENGVCIRCDAVDPNNPRIVLADTSGCEGSLINIPITLETNPGIVSMRLLIAYDRNVLELQSATLSDVFRTAQGVQYVVNTTAYPAVINWLALTDDVDAAGLFATLTFKVLSADSGVTVVTAAYDQADVHNSNMEDVTFDVENSTITLGVHNLYHVSGTSATCVEDGELEHWYCGVCERSFADEDATVELSDEELVIPALGHDFEYCTGVCTRCGAQDPSFPTADSPTFRIAPTSGTVGREVTVKLQLEHNPGVCSANLLLRYDAARLVFQSAELSELADLENVLFSADDSEQGVLLSYTVPGGVLSGDGDFIAVTFMIREDAGAGDTPLSVTYSIGEVTDAENVSIRFYCVGANLQIKLRITGDVNGDGKVNNKDARLLFQYVSNVALAQVFYQDAADVNGDGRINNKDARLLFQYVSGMPVVLA